MMTTVDSHKTQQLDLLDETQSERRQQVISDSVIQAQPNFLAAIKLAVQVSGLEDKQVYMPLGIDKAHWSRIMSGQAHFPENKIEQFMDLVSNEIPLIWLSWRRGYDLTPREDAKDKKIRELEANNRLLQQEIDTLQKYGVIHGHGK